MSIKDEDILKLARSRFQTVQTAESDIRKSSLENIRFTYNVDDGQWDDDIRKQREEDKRPCLTANKLRKFVAQVANKERENRIAIKVVPVDDKSDPQLAQIHEGIIRNIEYQSNADEIYCGGGEQAIAGGFGYWRILADYTDDSFEQEIKIAPIDNQFSVYYDPQGNFCFIREGMSRDDFKEKYPNAEQQDFDLSSLGESYALWHQQDKIFIAEYFTKEPVIKTIAQILNPVTQETEVIELTKEITAEALTANGFQILKTREAKSHKVMWYKMTATQILERREWAGKYIPVVEVVGDRVNIEGKVYKRSLIQDAKDPQRMYNYWLTSMTEKVALVPKAPFLVTVQEIKGHEGMWKSANTKNHPYLLYNSQGQRVPERQQPAQIDTGAMAMLNIADSDIKDTMGMYNPALGQESNERSGIALKARQSQSDMGTFQFPDNLRRAIVYTGKILLDLIPRIYDTARIIRLRNYEGENAFVPINQEFTDEKGQTIIYDLSQGKYDVQADIRMYSTRREETVSMMTQAMQYAPMIAPALAPLIFEYMDSPGAERIKETITNYLASIPQSTPKSSPGRSPGEGTGTFPQ